MDTLILDIQDYSTVPVRPWIAKLGKAKTYSNLTLMLLAIGSITVAVTPAQAVPDDWDWDSETRQEQTDKSRGQADSNTTEIASEPTMNYETGRQVRRQPAVRDRQPQQVAPAQQEPVAHNHQPQQTEQPPEQPMTQNQTPDPTRIQVIDDWRATRQSPAERTLEQNPGVEKDCDGKPFDDNEVFEQAEVDESGNVTAAGLEQIKQHGKSYCQSNPSAPQCQADKDGDVG